MVGERVVASTADTHSPRRPWSDPVEPRNCKLIRALNVVSVQGKIVLINALTINALLFHYFLQLM